MPASTREHVTTEELLAVTGTTHDILYRWVAENLLPRPSLVPGTDGRKLVAAWSPDAFERVRFITAKQRQGLEIDEIAALVAQRWPKG